MKHAQKLILLGATAVLGLAAPGARASTLSINDSSEAEIVTFQVAAPNTITSVGDIPPGSGPFIDLSQPTDPANKISDLSYNSSTETLSFTFANQINWGSSVYLYRYYTETSNPGAGSRSDLFVIQGRGGTTPDFITFISRDGLTGDPVADGVGNLFGATPLDLGTQNETGGWQLAFNTGVDQYYIASDAPGPVPGAGLAGLASLALAGLYARKRRA
jgi:hypothetical protein